MPKTIALNLMINNEPNWVIDRCIESVVDLVEQMIIYASNHRKDLTVLKKYGELGIIISIIYKDLKGSVVEEWRNEMQDRSTTDWVIVLDPDEYLDEDAIQLVRDVKNDKIPSVNDPLCAGITFDRINIQWDYESKKITDNYGDPEKLVRFSKRGSLQYSDLVHRFPVLGDGRFFYVAKDGKIMHDKKYESKEEWARKSKLFESKAMEQNGTMDNENYY